MLSLLLLVAGAVADPIPALIEVTPTSVRVAGAPAEPAAHPLVTALDRAGPGTVIRLDQGQYQPFTIGLKSNAKNNSRTRGGAPGNPIVLEGAGIAKIVAKGGDTIAIDQASPVGHILFRDLEIVAGSRAGVIFYRQHGGRSHRGFHFEDVRIVGRWDPLAKKGAKSKWGVWGHSLDDFRFTGRSGRSYVRNIRSEHAFYLQNPVGDVTIEGVHARLLGRTFVQLTCRGNDGPVGRGTFLVKDCVVNDVGIAEGDGYKGGSAFTLAGRFEGTAIFEGNSYRAGFNPKLHRLTNPGEPYGTGALVAWDEGQAPNALLVLRDNDFEFASGCGDRPVVAIGGCRKVLILGKNRFHSGGKQPALALDPVRDDGSRISAPNGSVHVAPLTDIDGPVTIRGAKASKSELRELMKPR
jgi:hypothetical protein